MFWKFIDIWDNNIPVSERIDFDNFGSNIVKIFESGRIIYKNDLEGKQSHNVTEVQM